MTGAVRVVPRPAPAWAFLVALVHALAVAGAWMVLPPLAALIASAGLVLAAWIGAGAAMNMNRFAVRELELRPDGSAAMVDAHGEWHEVAVSSAAMFGSWFAALALRGPGIRRSVVLVHGCLDDDTFRRVRVWLRWRRRPDLPASAEGDAR